MDLSAVKNRLENLTNKPSKKEKIDYSKYLWKPTVGKHQVRIVPSVRDKANPFQEVFLHYGLQKFPIYALTNWGETDPVVEFAKGLTKTGVKEDYFLSKKMEPKRRVFVPVIVRGEEEKGVRLWEFGTNIYKQLLSIADDEDYGDYTDIQEGRDFTVEAGKGDVGGNQVTLVNSVRVKPKTSMLTQDPAQLELWLNEQPDILSIQRHYTFDEMKDILNKWLDASEDAESNTVDFVDTTTSTNSAPNDLPFETDNLPEAPAKKGKGKFDNLFK